MGRQRKHPDEAKLAIIRAAGDLFARSGYDGTPIEAVVEKLGVSKGAFYHYFKSKEELLDAVVDRMIDEGIAEIEEAAGGDSAPALERLNRWLAAARRWRLAHFGMLREMAAVLYRDENAIIRQKANARNVALALPGLAAILEHGMRSGAFDISDPEETARLILHLGNYWGESVARVMIESRDPEEILVLVMRRGRVVTTTMERILGIPPGSIERPDTETIAKVIRKR